MLSEDRYTVFKVADQPVNSWSGGKTTQLYIDPPEALFADRNFNFRISTATVETEKSEFTPLPGYERILMILDGRIKLDHLGHHSAELQVYEQDRFSGSWTTQSIGKVRDFNLIFKPEWQAELAAKHVAPGESIRMKKTNVFAAIYLTKGEASIGESTIHQGDFVVLHTEIDLVALSAISLIDIQLDGNFISF